MASIEVQEKKTTTTTAVLPPLVSNVCSEACLHRCCHHLQMLFRGASDASMLDAAGKVGKAMALHTGDRCWVGDYHSSVTRPTRSTAHIERPWRGVPPRTRILEQGSRKGGPARTDLRTGQQRHRREHRAAYGASFHNRDQDTADAADTAVDIGGGSLSTAADAAVTVAAVAAAEIRGVEWHTSLVDLS